MRRICPCWAGVARNSTENGRESGGCLMALAQRPALKRDNWPPSHPWRRGGFWQLDRRFRQLLGDAEQMLAPLHLLPDVVGHYAGRRPQHGKIIEQVGAFADHGVAL